MEEYIEDCVNNLLSNRACVLTKPEYTSELERKLSDLGISWDSAFNIEGLEVLRVS